MRHKSSQVDLCILGGGRAGRKMAASASALGYRVLLVDPQQDRYIPKPAALFTTLGALEDVRDWQGAWERALQRAEPYPISQLEALHVTCMKGWGRFLDPHHVEVRGEDGTCHIYHACFFVLATGTKTPPNLSVLAHYPSHIQICGKTLAGVEWADLLARKGVSVTLLANPLPLLHEDMEFSCPLLAALYEKGIRIEESVEATKTYLAFPPPEPCLDDLGLEAAHIRQMPTGSLCIDAAHRTSQSHIFALGSVAGEGEEAACDALSIRSILEHMLLPWPVARKKSTTLLSIRHLKTHPSLLCVGLGEAEARKIYGKIRIARAILPTCCSDGASSPNKGHMKVITTSKGRILGAAVMGEKVDHWGLPFQMAISQKMKLRDFLQLPLSSVSDAFIFNKLAMGDVQEKLRRPFFVFLCRLLRWWKNFLMR